MRYFTAMILLLLWIPAELAAQNAPVPSGLDSVSGDKNYFIYNSAPYLFVEAKTLTGELEYDHGHAGDASHTNYRVDYNGVGLETGGGYRFKGWGLFLSGGFLFLNYWSAEHNTLHFVEDNARYTTYITTTITEHQFPRNLYYGSFGLDYAIPLSGVLQIVPYITAQLWHYRDNRFYPKSSNEDVHFELHDNYSWGGGVSLKGLFSNNAILLKLGIMKNNFNPAGYFESINAESVYTSNSYFEFSLGYHFSFTGFQIGFLDYRFNFL